MSEGPWGTRAREGNGRPKGGVGGGFTSCYSKQSWTTELSPGSCILTLILWNGNHICSSLLARKQKGESGHTARAPRRTLQPSPAPRVFLRMVPAVPFYLCRLTENDAVCLLHKNFPRTLQTPDAGDSVSDKADPFPAHSSWPSLREPGART